MEVKKWRLEGMYNTRIMSDTGLIAVCDVDQPDYYQNGVLIAAAPETARKLAEAEARIEELEKAVVAVNRWYAFAQHNPHRDTQERIKMMDYALLQCKTVMERP